MVDRCVFVLANPRQRLRVLLVGQQPSALLQAAIQPVTPETEAKCPLK